jgi:hypothetical protein
MLLSGGAAAPQAQGPISPAQPPKVRRIPRSADVPAPPLPVEEIVRRVTENDTRLLALRAASGFKVSLRVQEFDEKGNEVGNFRMSRQVTTGTDGKQYVKSVEVSNPSLKLLKWPQEDLEELADLPAFALPVATLERYELEYAGQQAVDELNTYVFRIRPKQLERRVRLFEGIVYVDDQDFAIVRSYGRYVGEVEQDEQVMPFEFFETYREGVAAGVWLPAFLRSEFTSRTGQGEVRIRLTLRFTDYSLPPSAAQPPAAAARTKP